MLTYTPPRPCPVPPLCGDSDDAAQLLADVDVIGIPKAQPRPRAAVRGRHAMMYDPGTASEWRQLVAAELEAEADRRQEGRGSPAAGAIAMDLAFRIPRPKSHYSTKKFSLRPSAPSAHIIKPDCDNLAKAVLDETHAIIKDDRQVVALNVTKRYVEPGEKGGVHIRIWSIPQL